MSRAARPSGGDTPGFGRFVGLGTVAVVGTASAADLPEALLLARAEVAACDRAASRFRDDSDLSALNRHAENRGAAHPFSASAWLCEAITVAQRAAVATDGLVDPTIGGCLVALGYDRSFETLPDDGPLLLTASHRPAWEGIQVDARRREIRVPRHARIDLGATAKALCADRAAATIAARTGGGALVSLGGDVAVAGPAPAGGWSIRVTDRADTPPEADVPGQSVAVVAGGLATSGTSARRWKRAGHDHHHLVDPRTARPAEEVWRTVTVAAASCVEANTASTAAVLLGPAAGAWLERRGLDARLVATGGDVTTTGRWPLEDREARAS